MIDFWLTAMVVVYLGAAMLGLILHRQPALALTLAHLGTAFGALAGLGLAVDGLAGVARRIDLGALTPFARLTLRLDPLASFFLLLITGLMLAAAIYALGYVRPQATRSPLTLAVGLPLFGLTMSLVPLADNVFLFLLLWETMSLVSYFLVIEDQNQPAVQRAGFTYLVMTHAGTVLIIIAMLIMAGPTGQLDFRALQAGAAQLPPVVRDLVFLLTLFGFATKAGLVPMHVWLPRAHPVAPSHISALMSGVMIKTGFYGLLRVGWELLGPGPVWWGGLVIVIGVASALLGVLYAFVESDLKGLLAFSTIENAGLIAIGLGVAFYGRSLEAATLATVGLAAGLLHMLNHALFKGLLFLAAGAILHATGTRNLERLGGLLRRMPITGALLIIGGLALAALPPLNGFLSEWLLLQALLSLGLQMPGWPALLAGLAATGLALTGALALATSVKLIGIGCLGVPRGPLVERAHEAGPAMLAPMVGLAAICLLLGLLPAPAMIAIGAVTSALAGTAERGPAALPVHLLTLSAGLPGSAQIAPPVVAGLLVLVALLPWPLLRLFFGAAPRRIDEVWVCGEPLSPRMQYTSASFAKPIRLIFQAIIQPVRTVAVTYQGTGQLFLKTMTYRGETRPLVERYLYYTTHRTVLAVARATRVIQNGSIRLYLTYILVALVILLLFGR